MKNFILFTVLLFTSLSFSQLDFANQVKKKDVEKGLVTFEKTTADNGTVTYGFKMNNKPVGSQFTIDNNGVRTYSNYNKDHEEDGTTIIMNADAGEITMYTYRDNEKDGPAFKMANGKVDWTKQFKKGKDDPKGYTVNHDFDYYARNQGPTLEGFTIEKYKSSYALGYFAYGRKAYPMIHVWDEGDSYYGQYIQGERKEFGVYFYKNGDKYIGFWHKNDMEGLGFKITKDGEVIEKGFYKDNQLEVSL